MSETLLLAFRDWWITADASMSLPMPFLHSRCSFNVGVVLISRSSSEHRASCKSLSVLEYPANEHHNLCCLGEPTSQRFAFVHPKTLIFIHSRNPLPKSHFLLYLFSSQDRSPSSQAQFPSRIVSPYVTQISPGPKATSPAALSSSKKRLPVLGSPNPRRPPSPGKGFAGPQMIINNRASRPFDDTVVAHRASPTGRRLTKPTGGGLAPTRGGLPEIGNPGERVSRASAGSRSTTSERSRTSNHGR